MKDSDFKLIKTEKISNIMEEVENCDVYVLKLNEKILGYSLVKKEEINNIYIHILEENRGYGYGNILFRKLLEILKNENLKKIIIDIDITNYKMINILIKNNCVELTNMNGVKRFLLELK